jgi:large subunit ribosomal protein L17
MRHRKKGRHLGRTSSHRKALLRNLASSLFLTERETDDTDPNPPKTKGRIVTTLHKAKEVRPLVERCITIARRSLVHLDEAQQYATRAERGTDEWKAWRKSENWRRWNASIAPAVAARRRALQLIGDKQAVRILFEDIARRYADRPGGYTRILKLARPRLGDAGARAILELVGKDDRAPRRSRRPAFETSPATDERRD